MFQIFFVLLPLVGFQLLGEKKDYKFNQKTEMQIKHQCSMCLKITSIIKLSNTSLVGYEKLCGPVMLPVNINFPRHFSLWMSRGFYQNLDYQMELICYFMDNFVLELL